MFHNCEGQSHQTVPTDHNPFKQKGEPKWYGTEVLRSCVTREVGHGWLPPSPISHTLPVDIKHSPPPSPVPNKPQVPVDVKHHERHFHLSLCRPKTCDRKQRWSRLSDSKDDLVASCKSFSSWRSCSSDLIRCLHCSSKGSSSCASSCCEGRASHSDLKWPSRQRSLKDSNRNAMLTIQIKVSRRINIQRLC